MKITYYHRKPIPGAYSVERFFDDCRKALPSGIEYTVSVARFQGKGILQRLYNILEAIARQSDVNHITGDIHYVAFFLKKKKTTLTILDCISLDRLHGIKKALVFFFWYWIPGKKSAIITVISESTKKELLKHLSCKADKIRVVPCPVSDSFKPSPYTFNHQKPVILQIGTSKNKNILRVAGALAGIRCHLDIVGKLSTEQITALQRNKIEYSSAVNISLEQMVRKYVDCDIVVFASTYEGFGLPIVEANATGRPVVTSNILSMPEVAGDAACLVDPFDVQSIREGILRVITDTDYRNQLILNGFNNVKRFQPEVIAAQYVAIYKELMAK